MLNSNTPISREQMYEVAPAIFATEPYSECSDKYKFISTVDVLDAMQGQGFHPYMIGQTTPRKTEKNNFAKHMIRLRKGTVPNNDGTYNEIILKNSSDRSSAAILMAGSFTIACMNGLICGNIVQEVHIRHSGNHVDEYIDGAYTICEQFEKVNESKARMQQRLLSFEEANEFATEALKLRWPDPEQETIQAEYLLTPHRREDLGHDLFTVFNVVQENIIRGGIKGYTNKGNVRSIRKITGVDQLTSLNKQLWNLSDQYANA
jgi:hypothetical protein